MCDKTPYSLRIVDCFRIWTVTVGDELSADLRDGEKCSPVQSIAVGRQLKRKSRGEFFASLELSFCGHQMQIY